LLRIHAFRTTGPETSHSAASRPDARSSVVVPRPDRAYAAAAIPHINQGKGEMTMNPNTQQQDFGKLILRVALGVLILLHGIAKLTGGLEGIEGLLVSRGLPGFLAYGALVGEVLAPLLVLVGFHARIGAVLIALNMLVALALVHAGELLLLNDQGGWAVELQGMFLFTAIAIALLGPGRHSVNGR
jgi:putative oxidoreductase